MTEETVSLKLTVADINKINALLEVSAHAMLWEQKKQVADLMWKLTMLGQRIENEAKAEQDNIVIGQCWNVPDGRTVRIVYVAGDKIGVRNARTNRLSYMPRAYFKPMQKWHLTLREAASD